MDNKILWKGKILLTGICLMLAACSSKDDKAYNKVLATYNKAQLALEQTQSDKALNLYKACTNECAKDQYEQDDSVQLLLPKALVQTLNIYQSNGKTEECIAYFDSLRNEVDKKRPVHHNSVLINHFKRDVYVLLAYSLSRTDAEEKAAQVMDAALSMPLSYPTHERLFRDYAYAAGVYYCVPAYQEKVLKYGRMALDEIQLCENKSGAQWLVALMAKLYQGKGDISKAIGMCREGYELAESSMDTLGMANSMKELADYLYQWRLYDEANKYASNAITLIEQTSHSNPMVATVAYTIKAKILKEKGNTKEALAYLNKAKASSIDLPYNSGASDVDLLWGKIYVADTLPAHHAQYDRGIKLLQKVAKEASYKLRAQAFFELAKTYLQHGKKADGEATLDSMYAITNTTNPPFMVEDAYQYAQAYYLKKGDVAQVVNYAAALNRQGAEMDQTHALQKAVKSLAQFEMEKQEEYLKQKEREMEIRRKMEIAGIFLGIIALISFSSFMIYKRKKMREQHLLTEQELSKVQTALTQTTQEKEQVEQELKNIEKPNVDKVKAGISLQQILDMKGDKKFKDYFSQAYPNFLVTLRKQVADLTSKEELYCMLMSLNTTNEDLARIFSIARSSVVVAKYRIRKKLKLEEGVSMEDYMEKLRKTEEIQGEKAL